MELSKTQIKTIASSLVVFVLILLYGGLFVTIKNKNNGISSLQNQVDIAIRKDERLYSMKQLVANLETELDQIDTYFVPQDGVVDFLENLEALGSIAGAPVDINSVSVKEHGNDAFPYESLQVEFGARGSWSSIVWLISLFETYPQGITIQRLQFEQLTDLDSDSGSDSWRLRAHFSVLKLK